MIDYSTNDGREMAQICNEDGTYETLPTTKTSMHLLRLDVHSYKVHNSS